MLEISGDLRIIEILGDVFKLGVELSPKIWERLKGADSGLHTRSKIAQVGTHFNPVEQLSYENGMIITYCRPEVLGRYLKGFDPRKPLGTEQWNGLHFNVGDKVANLYFQTGNPLSRAEIVAALSEGAISFGSDCEDDGRAYISDEGQVYLAIGKYMFGLNGKTPASVKDLESRGEHLVAYEGNLFFLPRRATITRTSGSVQLGGDLGMLLNRAVIGSQCLGQLGSEGLIHLRSLYLGPATDHSIILEIENRSSNILRLQDLAVTGTVHRVIDHDTPATEHATPRNSDGYQVIKP